MMPPRAIPLAGTWPCAAPAATTSAAAATHPVKNFMIETLLSGLPAALFHFSRRGAPSEGLIRSFIGDFGADRAGTGRVCFKTGAAQLLESD
jgi:hypothetical protein